MNQTESKPIFTLIRKCSLLLMAIILLISSCKKDSDSKPNDDGLPSTNTRELLYISNNNIYSMDENGNNVQQLTFYTNEGFISDIDYSRTTDKILFSKFNTDTSAVLDLFIMDSNGSNIFRITNNNYRGNYPSFNKDGSKIIFTTSLSHGSTYSSNVFSLNPDGSNLTNLTNYSDSANNLISDANLSPNDSTLLFYGEFPGLISGFYIMNMDGSNLTRVTTGGLEGSFPKFSPDGTKILFRGYDFQSQQRPKTNLYSVNLDGTQLTNLTNYGSKFYTVQILGHNYSNDGNTISFISDIDLFIPNGDGQELYFMDSDGSNLIRKTNDTIRQIAPIWK